MPVELAQDMGYVTVGEHIDPVDWARPGEKAIIERTLSQLHDVKRDMPRNIVLLHDAGGDRSQTVAALPSADRHAARRGLSLRAGLGPCRADARRSDAAPVADSMALLTDRFVFMSLNMLGHVLYLCFLAAIVLGVGRMLLLVVRQPVAAPHAERRIRRRRRRSNASMSP